MNEHELSAFMELQRQLARSLASMERAVAKMEGTVSQVYKIPVSIAIIAAVTWLFHMGKVGEYSWGVFMFVALFPWYGDGIRFLVGKKFGGGGGVSAEEVVQASKLVVLVGLGAAFFLGH